MGSSRTNYNSVEPQNRKMQNGTNTEKLGGNCCGENQYQGATVSFHNLYYEIQVGAGCCKKKPKTIINNVSGVFKPGTMNAIMGPTGSGKSSLLDILAARKDPKGLSGKVLINGHPQPADFRLMSGYVVQDDVVMGTLSIRENLRFSADLRLPKDCSSDDKAEAVNNVISVLGLDACADTRVGDEFTRGVSGGERKRCNVGMELITAPGVLFLDEPTTGLDASTANSVMLNLKRLAERGSTIIFSIHQPRYSIFKLCDTLCLLGNGETIYFGPAMEGLEFFKSLGHQIEEHDNPADFFLDVILSDSSSDDALDHVSTIPIEQKSVNGTNVVVDIVPDTKSADDAAAKQKARCSFLAKQFTQSKWGQQLEDSLNPLVRGIESSGEHMPSSEEFETLSYKSNLCIQFGVVCGRTIKNLIRNPRTSTLQVATMIFFGLVTGGIYFKAPDTCQAGIQNRVGAFFFMIMNMVFGNLSGIDLFIKERTIFIHENISGFYRVSSYFFAKLLCDVIPNRTVPLLFFAVITYFMIGFVPTVENFFIFLLTLFMVTMGGASIAFVAGASTRTPAIASLLCALMFVFQMIFSGLLINLDSLGDWIHWAKYLSLFSYGMQALQINELKNIELYASKDYRIKTNCTIEYLVNQGIKYESDWDFWQNILALAVITVGLLLLTYIQLRRIKKLK